MRNILFCFGLIFLLFACNSDNKKGMSANGNEEQELMALESEMIDFFQSTLEKNYGDRYAVGLFVKGMEKYHFNYVLEVDKERLKEINRKLYGDDWLYSYFLDKRALDVSGSNRQQMYNSAQVELTPLALNLFPKDGFSYYQKELKSASHPAMKEMVKIIDATGVPIPSLIWGQLNSDNNRICSDFKSDRDIQMFLTLFCWKYLCHSANIDFRTGEDRTEVVMKEAGY